MPNTIDRRTRNRLLNSESWIADNRWWHDDIYILGGGPSLNDVNFDLIKDKHVIGVNNAYGDRICDKKGNLIEYKCRDWVDVCFYGDGRWFDWHKEWIKNFKGQIFSCATRARHLSGVVYIQRGKSLGIETKTNAVSWNRSSGATAISLAYHFGAKRIILLGFDMKMVNGKGNWHNDHKTARKDPSVYRRFNEVFKHIKKDADKLGVEILNATTDSAIADFKVVKLEDIIC